MELLSIIGPLLTAFGALLMAYDIVRGPVRQFKENSFNKQLEFHNESLNSSLETYKALTDVYSPESIQELITEAQERTNRMISSSQDSYSEFMKKELKTSFIFLVRGFLMVALGSLFQASMPRKSLKPTELTRS